MYLLIDISERIDSISVKEYDKIHNPKDLEIEIKKCSTTTTPVIVEALSMIKKGGNKHINKISGCPSQIGNTKQLHFTELQISLGECDQFDWKILLKRDSKKT